MKLRALIGWGIVIYAIVYLVWSALAVHGVTGILGQIVIFCAMIAVSTSATLAVGSRTERDILPYAVGWMAVVIALDAVIAVPTAGWQMYGNWNLWVGYVLVLLVPLLVVLMRKNQPSTPLP